MATKGLLVESLSPTTVLRVAVLGALEAVEYGPQSLVAGRFVLLYASGLVGELGHPGGKAGTSPDGEDAPGEDAVGPFEGRVLAPVFEQVFEGRVEGFGGFEGEAQLDLPGGIAAGRAQRIFSR